MITSTEKGINLLPANYTNVEIGKFYFRTPDCITLFVVESRPDDKLAVVVGKILSSQNYRTNDFDLKRIQPADQLYEFIDFPHATQFRDQIKKSGHCYIKAIEAAESVESPAILIKDHGENISRSLDYLSVGRKLVGVNNTDKEFYPLPNRSFYVFDLTQPGSVNSPLSMYSRPVSVLGTPVDCLPVTIEGRLEVTRATVEAGRKQVLDKLAVQSSTDCREKETKYIIDTLIMLANINTRVHDGKLNISTMRSVFNIMESEGEFVTKLVGNPSDIAEITSWNECDEATIRERLTTNLFGHLWTADIHSCKMPENTLLLTSCPADVGEMLLLGNVEAELTDYNQTLLQYKYSYKFALGLYGYSLILRIK